MKNKIKKHTYDIIVRTFREVVDEKQRESIIFIKKLDPFITLVSDENKNGYHCSIINRTDFKKVGFYLSDKNKIIDIYTLIGQVLEELI